MQYILKGHIKEDTVIGMLQLFYPNTKYTKLDSIVYTGILLESILDIDTVECVLFENGNIIFKEIIKLPYLTEEYIAWGIKKTIYLVLNKYTGIYSSWGLLTGIRPAKKVTEFFNEGLSYDDIKEKLTNFYLVSPKKADLAIEVSQNENNIIKNNIDKNVSIYIGIPFCPTRCLYCSFTSYPINVFIDKIDSYINALIKEIKYAGKILSNKNIESIYIGGGTPTSINEYQLEKILYNIFENFNLNNTKEFTIEAGRPDTISIAKLKVLKKYNISRISINPQTMNDKTLKLIGRDHTVQDFLNIFNMARNLGFNNINVDLILGLPKETINDVEHTFKTIEKLNPENITVHTLSIKRASILKEKLDNYNFVNIDTMEKMLEIADNHVRNLEMFPYYMYRQKNTIGNFENIGYCKKGFENIYNVQIMEEKQSILGLGSGSSSKFVDLKTNKIERVFNVKSVDDYINRIDEMINRKVEKEEFFC